jgi:hypothetical protein
MRSTSGGSMACSRTPCASGASTNGAAARQPLCKPANGHVVDETNRRQTHAASGVDPHLRRPVDRDVGDGRVDQQFFEGAEPLHVGGERRRQALQREVVDDMPLRAHDVPDGGR